MPDGKTLVTAGYFYDAAKKKSVGEVCLRKVVDGSLIATLRGTTRNYSLRSGSLAVASTGKLIAAAGATEERPWVVDVFDVATKNVAHTLRGNGAPIMCLAFSPKSEILAVAHMRGTVELWNPHDGKLASSFVAHKDGICSAAFSPTGQFFAIGNNDGSVTFWNAKNSKSVGQIPWQGDVDHVGAVAFSPDGKLLAYGGMPNRQGASPVYVWEIIQIEARDESVTAKLKAKLEGHRAFMYSLVFSPNGGTLASANQDETVKLWDVRTNKELATIVRHMDFVYDVAFSPDGKVLATVGRDSLNLWTMKQLKLER